MKSLCDLLKNAAKKTPQKGIFVVNNNVEDVFISYAELAEKSRKIAHVLNSYYAIQPKSKIIISVAKSEDFIMLFWGCVFANCVPVLMPSVRLNNKETVDYDRFKNAKEILGNPILISNDFNLCNAYENNNAIYIENIFGQMELVSDGEVCSPNIRKDELCVIQFSSGSTGNPRGVMLSFDKIIANIKAKTFADHITREDKLIHWMPYFHDYGLFGNHLVCVYNCITEVKVEPFSFLRDPVVFIQKIEQYDITVCGGTTPSGLELLSKKVKDKEQELKGIDLSHIKTLSVGAEMVPPNLFSRLEPLFKLGLRKESYIPSYGMAETTLIVSACTHGYGNRTIKIERDAFYDGIIKPCNNDAPFCEFTSAGTVLPCFQVRIEKDGISQGNMQIGEIQVKGDCVMMGYYNDKKSTDAVFKEGWLCTGDLGFFDTNNILYIVGRKKEVIIVNGQNYHPFDLEDSIIKKFTGEIEKSVLTSYYSTKIEREVVLHFFTLYKDVAETDVQQLVKKVNGFIANIAGFAPAYSIHIKKGNIQRTSSSKIKRRSMALSFEKGMYNKFIVNLMDNSTKNYELILKTIWEEILHIENILPDDNFFSLGGDSIRSMIAVSKIEKAFNVKLENSFFYQYSCINAQSKYLEVHLSSKIETPLNEYELLIKEFCCEELNISFLQLQYTDNLINKAHSFAQVYHLMQRLTEVFNKITFDDIKEETNIRDIAKVVKEHYVVSEGKPFPLMDFQETLFYHSKSFIRNEPTGLSCYIICRTKFRGMFELECWNKALNDIISHHPLLHSILYEESNEPEMVTLSKYSTFECGYEDITNMSKESQEDFFAQKDIESHDYRFDLKKFPLFYCNVYKTGNNEHEVLFHIDHQIIDGYSFFHFLQELLSNYDKLLSGEKVIAENEKGLSFFDYVFIERGRRKTWRYQNAMDFALKVFKDLPEKIILPTKQHPSIVKNVHFRTLHTELDGAKMNRLLNHIHNTAGICLNSLLMACYFKLMNLWSGQNDIIINMPVFNREQHLPTSKSVIGSFLDIFPVRIHTHPQEPIVSIARNIERYVRTMLKYPISSIELSRRIAEQEGLKQGSLSPIIFSNSINMLPKGISHSTKNFSIDPPKVQTGAPGTYIDLVLYTWEDKWCLDWNYLMELFDQQYILLLSQQYTKMVYQLVDAINTSEFESIVASDILPVPYLQMLKDNNNTEHEYSKKPIHEQVYQTVCKYPTREAISCQNKSLCYEDFWKRANQVAHFLRSLGVDRHSHVVLLLSRTIELPIVQLGILLAGGAYVPIDPSYPSDRIKYMIDDCGANVLITQGSHAKLINQAYTEKIKHCVLLEDTHVSLPSAYCRHTKEDIMTFPTKNIKLCNTSEDLIYIIYTSGSTGQPKGTMLRHRNVSNFFNYEKDAFNINSDSRFALITSYSFDMTVTSNWLPFVTGGSLHILSDDETKNVETLLYFLEKEKINVLNVTPSHFSMLVNAMDFLERPVKLSEQMTILLGAEIVNVSDINRWLERYPLHQFINEYGPTETTVASTFYKIPVEADGRCHLDTVPIGKPIYNTQVYVLNDDMKQTLPNVPGTLHIGGQGVSCGYLGKIEKTKAAFVINPISHEGIVYNTGDVVKMTEQGNLVFVGRRDFQINMRGYRIELGDIENALLHVPNIVDVCAEIQKDDSGEDTIVVFYVSKEHRDIDPKNIMKVLQARLPHYMIPKSMMRLEQLPISENGKTDKKQLPNIAREQKNKLARNIVGPRNEKEKQIVSIWQKVLGISEVSIYDNFWDIGGDSIRSIRLIKELKNFGLKEVKLKDLFEKPTIAELLSLNEDNDTTENVICVKNVETPIARLVCLPYAAGTPGMYNTFAKDFVSNVNIYTVQYPGHGDDREIKATVDEVGELLFGELRKFNDGIPLFIMGYSYSCYIAYDLCKRFEKANIPLRGIIMIGGTPPTLRDILMDFFSNEDNKLLDYSRTKDLLNEELISTLTEKEKHEYLHELRMNTVAMVNYRFLDFKLRTTLCSVVGKEDEPTIRSNQQLWENYFQQVDYNELPGGHVLITKYHVELANLVIKYIEKNV